MTLWKEEGLCLPLCLNISVSPLQRYLYSVSLYSYAMVTTMQSGIERRAFKQKVCIAFPGGGGKQFNYDSKKHIGKDHAA